MTKPEFRTRNAASSAPRAALLVLSCAACAPWPLHPAPASQPVRCLPEVREDRALCAAVSALDQTRRLQECAWLLEESGYELAARKYWRYLERELSEGDIVARRALGGGLGSGTGENLLVTFRSGVRAIVKPRATRATRREAAAYRLDRLLGLNLVPVTVVRRLDGKEASFQYFFDGARNGWNDLLRGRGGAIDLFDALIGNEDRHRGNWLTVRPLVRDGDVRRIAIDHDRTFLYEQPPSLPTGRDAAFVGFEERFYRALRSASEEQIGDALETLLTEAQLRGLLRSRRDLLRELCSRRRARNDAC